MNIYLRPLKESDAKISYKWRNNPQIWKYTGHKPDKNITEEIELNWIRNTLKKSNEARYAICIKETDEYIGNVQLTYISNDHAEFHIFIGDEKYWGKNIGTDATLKMIQIGFSEHNVKEIYLFVNKNNMPAVKVYQKSGFQIESLSNKEIKMVIRNDK